LFFVEHRIHLHHFQMAVVEQHSQIEQYRLDILLSHNQVYKKPLPHFKETNFLLVLEDHVLNAIDIPIDEKFLVTQIYGEAD